MEIAPKQLYTYFKNQSKQLLEKSLDADGELAHVLWLWSLDAGLMAEFFKTFPSSSTTVNLENELLETIKELRARFESEIQGAHTLN